MPRNLNKLLSFVLLTWCLLCTHASAGTFIQFDQPDLIGYESNGKIYGYYGSSNSRTGFSCVFFFESLSSDSATESAKKITSFYTESDFSAREKSSDISGIVHSSSTDWIVQLEEQHGGCNSGAGWNFKLGPQNDGVVKFRITKKIPSLGLSVANKKTYFLNYSNHKFSPLKTFITPGDLVVRLKQVGGHSQARYLNTETKRITTGWIKDSDLINPYKQ